MIANPDVGSNVSEIGPIESIRYLKEVTMKVTKDLEYGTSVGDVLSSANEVLQNENVF